VRISAFGDTLVIGVRGMLDGEAARIVVDAARAAGSTLAPEASVEVDLREMQTWTSAGLQGLTACMALGARLRMGPQSESALRFAPSAGGG
jgi:hypothetical protein